MKKRVSSNIVVFFIVAGVIVLLLNTGSAKAINLALSVLNSEVFKGETISFNASVEVEAEDGIINIDEFILKLSGPELIECRFYPNGTIIDEELCPGITITKISEAPYGYGYGYGYGYNGYKEGFFEYNIEIESENYTAGLYESYIIVKGDEDDLIQKGEDIEIKVVPPTQLRGCSVRAVQGMLNVNDLEFDDRRNKISFFISKSRSKPVSGHGYFVAQDARDRFEYDFDISEVISNTPKSATMIVSGKYKVNRGAEKTLNTVITFSKDRKKGTVNMTEIPVDFINASNMKISFIEGCNRN